MSELIPCPYCAYELPLEESLREAILELDGNIEHPSMICCAGCGAAVVGGKTNEEAIKAWNTRVCHDELVDALGVWDSEKTESLSHLLKRITHDLDSGNIVIEYGAYSLLMEVIEKQKAVLAKARGEA